MAARPLFPDAFPDEVVTDLAPVERGRWVSVKLGRRVAARLRPPTVARLGIEVGTTWTPELAAEAAEAAEFDHALDVAERALGKRPLSRRELIETLTQHGFPGALAERTADDLARRGLLGDQALAENLAHWHASKGPRSREQIAEKLKRRGIDPAAAQHAADEAAGDRSDRDAAAHLARERIFSLAPKLGPEAAARRTFALLARRGFDEETAREAVERALAARPEQGSDPPPDDTP